MILVFKYFRDYKLSKIFSFIKIILIGMDMVEIKGLSPELDICQLYIVCKEKILSKVEIRKNYKTFYSLKDSFL